MSKAILKSAKTFPIVAVLGPRQSGKTTLVRALFPSYQYVNLELPDMRRFAALDPRKFFSVYGTKTIIDEAQEVPELFSYLQVQVDEHKARGQYILTGSKQYLLMNTISQSLAGRVALLSLYPFALTELIDAKKAPNSLHEAVYLGGYPGVFAPGMDRTLWFGSYISAYLERDVRSLSHVGDLSAFDRFLRLCAGHTGQLLNLTSLGNDCGISHNTAERWISILETGFIATRVQPYFFNTRKRLVKSPKLYFLDTGLAAYLLGIRSEEELMHHPLFGALMETYVMTEYLKFNANEGARRPVYFYRDHAGREIDGVVETGGGNLSMWEIKSGMTAHPDWCKTVASIRDAIRPASRASVIYGGDEKYTAHSIPVIPWRLMHAAFTATRS